MEVFRRLTIIWQLSVVVEGIKFCSVVCQTFLISELSLFTMALIFSQRPRLQGHVALFDVVYIIKELYEDISLTNHDAKKNMINLLL